MLWKELFENRWIRVSPVAPEKVKNIKKSALLSAVHNWTIQAPQNTCAFLRQSCEHLLAQPGSGGRSVPRKAIGKISKSAGQSVHPLRSRVDVAIPKQWPNANLFPVRLSICNWKQFDRFCGVAALNNTPSGAISSGAAPITFAGFAAVAAPLHRDRSPPYRSLWQNACVQRWLN